MDMAFATIDTALVNIVVRNQLCLREDSSGEKVE